MANKDCKICGCKPSFCGDYYDKYESTIELSSEDWISLRAGKDENSKVFLYAQGDEECYYYPKYCPECGRKLRD